MLCSCSVSMGQSYDADGNDERGVPSTNLLDAFEFDNKPWLYLGCI